MLCSVAKLSKRRFGKLLSKQQQVDLLETQLLAGHNFKKG